MQASVSKGLAVTIYSDLLYTQSVYTGQYSLFQPKCPENKVTELKRPTKPRGKVKLIAFSLSLYCGSFAFPVNQKEIKLPHLLNTWLNII